MSNLQKDVAIMNELISSLKSKHTGESILVIDLEHTNLIDDFFFERAIRFLPLEEQVKIHQKKTVHGKHVALCNRLLQLFGCSIFGDISYKQVEVSYGVYGKPYLKGCPEISFSMSNGQRYVIQYLSRQKGKAATEIGADIASRSDYTGDKDLQTFCDIFSSSEYRHIRSCDSAKKAELFAYYWSLKECYTKFTGLGLNCDLSSIDFGELEVPNIGKSILRAIDGNLMWFYSRWVSSSRDEILTVCRKEMSAECGVVGRLDEEPTMVEVSLLDIIRYFECSHSQT